MYPHIIVIATDTSPSALSLAQKNAKKHGARVRFLHANLLDPSIVRLLQSSSFHPRASQLIVIANLPYLPLSDKKRLAPDVIKYEPASALFAKRDGMDINLKMLSQLAAFLRTNTLQLSVLLEFDPPQCATLKRESSRLFPRAEIHVYKDACGRNRFLKIVSPIDSLQ